MTVFQKNWYLMIRNILLFFKYFEPPLCEKMHPTRTFCKLVSLFLSVFLGELNPICFFLFLNNFLQLVPIFLWVFFGAKSYLLFFLFLNNFFPIHWILFGQAHQLAVKKLQIWRLPPILIVHLKRFQCVNDRWIKSHKIVDFPVSGLDLTDYLAAVPAATLHRWAGLGWAGFYILSNQLFISCLLMQCLELNFIYNLFRGKAYQKKASTWFESAPWENAIRDSSGSPQSTYIPRVPQCLSPRYSLW